MLGAKNPFLFLFTCRPIQDDNHPFCSFMKLFPCNTEIRLQGLNQASVRDLVSATLGRSTDDCAILSEYLFNITGGNIFHIQQQIIYFLEKGLLRFEEVWSWDDANIIEESGMQDTDVINILHRKIKRLPLSIQHILKVRIALLIASSIVLFC